jgi:hypothetical protein
VLSQERPWAKTRGTLHRHGRRHRNISRHLHQTTVEDPLSESDPRSYTLTSSTISVPSTFKNPNWTTRHPHHDLIQNWFPSNDQLRPTFMASDRLFTHVFSPEVAEWAFTHLQSQQVLGFDTEFISDHSYLGMTCVLFLLQHMTLSLIRSL